MEIDGVAPERAGSHSEPAKDERIRKRNGKACVRCRAVKAKCEGNGVDPCPKCKGKHECVYVPTQRGRKKGATNLKTRERERLALLASQRNESVGSQADGDDGDDDEGGDGSGIDSSPRTGLSPSGVTQGDAELLAALGSIGDYSNAILPSTSLPPFAVTAAHPPAFQQGSSRDLEGPHGLGTGGTVTPLDAGNVILDPHFLNSRILKHYQSSFPVTAAAGSPPAAQPHLSTGPSPHATGTSPAAATTGSTGGDGPIHALAASIGSRTHPFDPSTYPAGLRLWGPGETFESRPTGRGNMPIRLDLGAAADWTDEDSERALAQQRTYFESGVSAAKRDVGVKLEPTSRGILSELEVELYFRCFYTVINPQIGLLDPAINTSLDVRSKSAYLFTIILALGALACPSAPLEQITKLFAHAGKLEVVVSGTGAKSLEIVQGKLLHAVWGLPTEREVDDQLWCRLGQAHRMSSQLGLNQRRASTIGGDETAQRHARAKERTWMRVCVFDHSFARFSGRTSFGATEELVDDLDHWSNAQEALPEDRMVGALWELHKIEKRAYEELRKVRGDSVALETQRATLNIAVEAWYRAWGLGIKDHLTSWVIRCHGVLAKLVFTRTVLGWLPPSSPFLAPSHEDLVDISQIALTLVLELLPTWRRVIPRSISGTITYAGALLIATPQHHGLIKAVADGFCGTRASREVFDFAHHNGNFLQALLHSPAPPKEELNLNHWFEDALMQSWPLGDLLPLGNGNGHEQDAIPADWLSAWPPADDLWTSAFNSVLG